MIALLDNIARLCTLESSGKSINLCDSIIRLAPNCIVPQADGKFTHPGLHRFVRNPCNGKPLGTAIRLRVADQSAYHDPEHPSSIVLPVIPA